MPNPRLKFIIRAVTDRPPDGSNGAIVSCVRGWWLYSPLDRRWHWRETFDGAIDMMTAHRRRWESA